MALLKKAKHAKVGPKEPLCEQKKDTNLLKKKNIKKRRQSKHNQSQLKSFVCLITYCLHMFMVGKEIEIKDLISQHKLHTFGI